MRIGVLITIFGALILVLGIIFHYQGQAMVGPESSFMYANPEWVTYGLQIAVVGIAVLGIGIGLMVSKKT